MHILSFLFLSPRGLLNMLIHLWKVTMYSSKNGEAFLMARLPFSPTSILLAKEIEIASGRVFSFSCKQRHHY